MISKKIILTGSFGVGKTSLFNQFIYQEFSDKYLTTIGAKVNSKTVVTEKGDVTLLVWDISGEITQHKVPQAYFLGTSGIVYVVDLTRPNTFTAVNSDMAFLKKILPDTAIVVVANKKDLVSDEQLVELAQKMPIAWDYITSAKTGENVEKMFTDLALRIF